jgi:hypothetical protein
VFSVAALFIVLSLTRCNPNISSLGFDPLIIGNAHNIYVNEETNVAYAVGSKTCSGGLHMIDVANPASPQFLACYAGDGYTHDVHCTFLQ